MLYLVGIAAVVAGVGAVALCNVWAKRARARRAVRPVAVRDGKPATVPARGEAAQPVTRTRIRDGRLEMWQPLAGGWACAETDPTRPHGVCARPVDEDRPCLLSHAEQMAIAQAVTP